jgi:hypothetical protein
MDRVHRSKSRSTARAERRSERKVRGQTRNRGTSRLAQYVQSFCLLVGYRRNGLSLLGSLLNAHPDIVIAPDPDVLGLAGAGGVEREELFDQLVRRASAHYAKERKRSHPYVVEGGWQERFRTLRVVGAKCGDATMRRIGRDHSNLDLMEKNVRVPVRIIHVVRNPYDVVAGIARTKNKARVQPRTVAETTAAVAELAEINRGIIERRADTVFTLRYEGLMADPRSSLYAVCAFLGLDADEDYLEACAGIVLTRPHPAVGSVRWPEDARARVDSVIARYSFFEGYGPAA